MAENKKEDKDVLYQMKTDRRLLSYVPDRTGMRSNRDRRGERRKLGSSSSYEQYEREDVFGRRYLVDYDVEIFFKVRGTQGTVHGKAVDISTTGMV